MGSAIDHASPLPPFNTLFVQKPTVGVTSILEVFNVLHMDREHISFMSILNLNSIVANTTTGNVLSAGTLTRLRGTH